MAPSKRPDPTPESYDKINKIFANSLDDLAQELNEEEDMDCEQVNQLIQVSAEMFNQLVDQNTRLEIMYPDKSLELMDQRQDCQRRFNSATKAARKAIKLSLQNKKEEELAEENRREEKEDRRLQNEIKLHELKTALSAEKLDSSRSDFDSNIAPLPVLPRLELNTFSGRLVEFASWWETFKAAIDSNSRLTPITKLTYLRSCLRGPPLDKIASLSITNESYGEALKILQENYSRGRSVISSLVCQLADLNPVKNNSKDLSRFHDDVFAIKGSLKSNSVNIDDINSRKIVLPLLERKVTGLLRDGWERHASTAEEEKITIEEFLKQVSISAKVAESKIELKEDYKFRNVFKRSANEAVAEIKHCVNCPKESHHLWQCPKFKLKGIAQRQAQARSLSACFNCLCYGHSVADCKVNISCNICRGKHNSLLHISGPSSLKPEAQEFVPLNSATTIGHVSSKMSTILMTARSLAIAYKKSRPIRVLFDEGSQISFVTSSLVNFLGLKGKPSILTISGVSGLKGSTKNHFEHTVSLKTTSGSYISINAFEVGKISEYTEATPSIICSYPHLKGIDLGDGLNLPGKIDVLVGSDMMARFLTSEPMRIGASDQPYAKHTRLGWVIGGKAPSIKDNYKVVSSHIYANHEEEKDISKFWELEEAATIPKRSLKKDEIIAEEIFLKKVCRKENFHIEAPLPLKKDGLDFSESRKLALRRFNYLESKFKRNIDYCEMYHEEMNKNFGNGFIEVVPSEELITSNQLCYLPHHGVYKESSTTTKLRIVFDGSMKLDGGISLNNQLFVGPKVQLDLIDILYKWSFYPIAIVSDIEKMYNQVFLPYEQRDLLRFFWRPHPNGPVRECRHTRQVFGTASAAHSCISAVIWNSEAFKDKYPESVRMIKENMYVDDLVCGVFTKEEAKKRVKELMEINDYGGFPMKKWCSNKPEVFDNWPDELLNNESRILMLESTKALGYDWDPRSDSIGLWVNLDCMTATVTKRSVLAASAKFFDPQGRYAPVFFTAKLIFQETWSRKLDWDENLPDDLEQRWIKWKQELSHLKEARMPRCVFGVSVAFTEAQLCIFGDASSRGWGAVLYLRLLLKDGTVKVNFLASRTKVKPLKEITIPRMELEAALLAAKMIEHFQPLTPVPISSVHAWTDSSIVWYWLQKEASNWKMYIANRVQRIQEIIKQRSWHHVKGEENPADLASRGCLGKEFTNSRLWANGPQWLLLPEDEWPNTIPVNISELPKSLIETRKNVSINLTTMIEDCPSVKLLESFSTFSKVKRSLAWVIRFAKWICFKDKVSSGSLSLIELEIATRMLIRSEQKRHLSFQYGRLAVGQSLKKSDSLAPLGVYLDKDLVMRVGGRLSSVSDIPASSRNPYVIPKQSVLATLLIDYEHARLLHAGPETVLGSLRKKYWIIHGRSIVTSRFRKCVNCLRTLSKPMSQKMGNFPSYRASMSPSFTHSGVDFAGPFIVYSSKRSKVSQKAYLCLFSDLASRAVHLEMARSLSTEDFIICFRRFVCRRGIPRVLWSDQGRNFIGSSKIISNFLKENKNTFMNWSTNQGMEWKFIPPHSPHQGGCWESMVKITKNIFKRQFGNAKLTFDQLDTAFIEIEAVMNSRPLVAISLDSREDVLTPSMLITGFNIVDLPENVVSDHLSALSRWRKLQSILLQVRRRWMKEYVLIQQRRSKWKHPSRNLEVGDVVIVIDEIQGSAEWPVARIVEVFNGSDGLVRSAKVKFSNGKVYHRPVVKLALILPSEE